MSAKKPVELTAEHLREFRNILVFYAELLEKSEELLKVRGSMTIDGVDQIKKGLFSLRRILALHHGQAAVDKFPQVQYWTRDTLSHLAVAEAPGQYKTPVGKVPAEPRKKGNTKKKMG